MPTDPLPMSTLPKEPHRDPFLILIFLARWHTVPGSHQQYLCRCSPCLGQLLGPTVSLAGMQTSAAQTVQAGSQHSWAKGHTAASWLGAAVPGTTAASDTDCAASLSCCFCRASAPTPRLRSAEETGFAKVPTCPGTGRCHHSGTAMRAGPCPEWRGSPRCAFPALSVAPQSVWRRGWPAEPTLGGQDALHDLQ